ncbi:Desert hedgehog protein B [Porphyridium purpureum]|uniref:Desert hedgehog protein B n=1 Tax=Porphyridium purpureum TaxID=35688 RepID=A0A5J4YSH7_PORPP|nr:Desert hedgehog protein B [Porphyridium purpureum]|eukprot:POR2651..scf236_6
MKPHGLGGKKGAFIFCVAVWWCLVQLDAGSHANHALALRASDPDAPEVDKRVTVWNFETPVPKIPVWVAGRKLFLLLDDDAFFLDVNGDRDFRKLELDQPMGAARDVNYRQFGDVFWAFYFNRGVYTLALLKIDADWRAQQVYVDLGQVLSFVLWASVVEDPHSNKVFSIFSYKSFVGDQRALLRVYAVEFDGEGGGNYTIVKDEPLGSTAEDTRAPLVATVRESGDIWIVPFDIGAQAWRVLRSPAFEIEEVWPDATPSNDAGAFFLPTLVMASASHVVLHMTGSTGVHELVAIWKYVRGEGEQAAASLQLIHQTRIRRRLIYADYPFLAMDIFNGSFLVYMWERECYVLDMRVLRSVTGFCEKLEEPDVNTFFVGGTFSPDEGHFLSVTHTIVAGETQQVTHVYSVGRGALEFVDSDLDPVLNGDSRSACFAAGSAILLADGREQLVEDLAVGDRVWNAQDHSPDNRLFAWGHRSAHERATFVNISFAAGSEYRSLLVSPGHYIVVNGALTLASDVKQGDHLRTVDGNEAAVISIKNTVLHGLYNPHVHSGSLIVEGVQVSCYTSAVRPTVGHALLLAQRMVDFGFMRDIHALAITLEKRLLGSHIFASIRGLVAVHVS